MRRTLTVLILVLLVYSSGSLAASLQTIVTDPSGDVALDRIDVLTVTATVAGDELAFCIETTGSIPPGDYVVPDGTAFWYNIGLDIDGDPSTGHFEHDLGMDYWMYVGNQWNIGDWASGLGRWEGGVWHVGYDTLSSFSVASSLVCASIGLSQIEDPDISELQWYVRTFDNTLGQVLEDLAPEFTNASMSRAAKSVLALLDVSQSDRLVTVRIGNSGNTPLAGPLTVTAGLSYDTNWISEWETHFFSEIFPGITVEPGSSQEFSFTLPSVPEASYQALARRLVTIWTGYQDLDLVKDYVCLIVSAESGGAVYAFLPLQDLGSD